MPADSLRCVLPRRSPANLQCSLCFLPGALAEPLQLKQFSREPAARYNRPAVVRGRAMSQKKRSCLLESLRTSLSKTISGLAHLRGVVERGGNFGSSCFEPRCLALSASPASSCCAKRSSSPSSVPPALWSMCSAFAGTFHETTHNNSREALSRCGDSVRAASAVLVQ